jgi:hypothetical protein
MMAGLGRAKRKLTSAMRTAIRYGWVAWLAIGFLLFNSGAPHAVKTSRAPRSTLASLRVHFTDDEDMARYLSYVNAAIGRPYAPYYVRTLEEWQRVQERVDDAPDPLAGPRRSSPPLVPYRDYLVEYPPGFFLAALPPALLTGDIDLYRILFGSWMALALSIGLWLCARTIGELDRERGVRVPHLIGVPATSTLFAWSALALLAAGVVAVQRYDAAISLGICATYWACLKRRWLVAGAALGFAVAAKGVPLLLAPLALIHLIRADARRSRLLELGLFVASGAAVIAAVVLPAGWLATHHLLDSLRYHSERPIQIESMPGAIMGVLHAFAPTSFHAVKSYGSTNIVGPYAGLLSAACVVLAVVGAVAIHVQLWRRMRDRQSAPIALAAAFCGILVLYMTAGRVFSPQYLVWLLPLGGLVSLATGAVETLMLLAAFLLSQLIYPTCYFQVSHLETWSSILVLLRNLLVLYWGWRIVRGVPGASARQRIDSATVT